MQPGPPNFLPSCHPRALVGAGTRGVIQAMSKVFKLSAAPAILAAVSMAAAPALAADLPEAPVSASVEAAPAWSPGDDNAQNHRWYRYRRNRIDGGDVLAGVLILGGIAAIASAAKKSDDRRYRDRDYSRPYPDRRGDDWNSQYDDTRGIDRAVNTCVDEVERNARIETVDTVNRSARGWEVTGTLYNREGWTCSIGQDGRIEAIDYGRGREDRRYQGGLDEDRSGEAMDVPSAEARDDQAASDGQYGDDYYAAARARSEAGSNAGANYPGGPESPEESASDIEFGTGYKGKGA